MRGAVRLGVLLAATAAPSALADTPRSAPTDADCCRHEELAETYGVIWTGTDQTMTIERLAAYAAPVLWFSPDEPLLKLRRRQGSAKGKEIVMPEPFPFESDPGSPVAYYRVRRILQRIDEPGAGTYVVNPDLRGQSVVDLGKIAGIDLDFFFYYSKDFGGGTHVHDVESVETRLAVARSPGCQECPWVLGLVRATGKAHGIQWYDTRSAWTGRRSSRSTSSSRRASTLPAPTAMPTATTRRAST
jgi:hypothetical protein